MNYEELKARLIATGSYATGDVHPTLPDRAMGWSDAWFHMRVTSVCVWNTLYARGGRFDMHRWGMSSCNMVRIFEYCGARLDVRGLEHVRDAGGPVVFVGNHMSVAETILLPCMLLPFRDITVVLKESLLRYPFFGSILRAIKPIAVTRSNAREDLKRVLEEGQADLKAGRSILLFPQSTRTTSFNPGRFNSLGARLASRAGVPLVPLALKTDFMGLGRIVKDIGPLDRSKTVHIEAGPAIPAADMKAAHETAVAFITERLRSWGVTIEENNHDA